SERAVARRGRIPCPCLRLWPTSAQARLRWKRRCAQIESAACSSLPSQARRRLAPCKATTPARARQARRPRPAKNDAAMSGLWFSLSYSVIEIFAAESGAMAPLSTHRFQRVVSAKDVLVGISPAKWPRLRRLIIACNRAQPAASALRAYNGSSAHYCTLEAMRTQGLSHDL